jgi:hypothetical protein
MSLVSKEQQASITWRSRYDAAKKHGAEFNDPPPDYICAARLAWDKARAEAEKEFGVENED